VAAGEGVLPAAPHLQADLQGLLQPFEPLGGRREVQAKPGGFLLVDADAEPGTVAGQRVQGGHGLGEQAGPAVGHRCHERVQQNPFGCRGEVAEGCVGLEHALLGGARELPEVVHDGQPGDADGLGVPGQPARDGAKPGGPPVQVKSAM